LILIGGAALAPAVTAAVVGAAVPLARKSASLRLAAGQVRTALRRDAATVAALGSALAMAIGVSIMVESFRSTVDLWIGQTVRGDLYVSAAAQHVSGADAVLDREVIQAIESLPGLRTIDRLRQFEVRPVGAQGSSRPARGHAVSFRVLAQESAFQFRRGEAKAVLTGAADDGAVVVSEPFSRHHAVDEGDTLLLNTPSGPVAFPVAGVYTDYTSDSGMVLVDLPTYRRWWRDESINSFALYLDDERQTSMIRDMLRTRLPERDLVIRSHRDIRDAALAQFDQTFAVTTTLKLIALVVAWAGAFFTLTAGVAERRSELGMLRAVGAGSGLIRRAVLGEAMLIALAAFVLGSITGIALALLLVHVINPQFFGWTIHWVLTPRPFVEALIVVAIAAAGAVWLPVRAALRTDPVASLREE
jgi:putative ABC transport system permease protein